MDSAPPAPKGLARNTANYGDRDFALYLRRSFAKSMGYSQAMLDRPVVGIVDTGSDYNNCHRTLPDLVEATKRGVLAGGALPLAFPTVSLCEPSLFPTSMHYRNLAALDTEAMLTAQPMDAAVLIGGCDKTVPAQLMAAASADVPAILLVTGPMLATPFQGERLSACTDCRRYWAAYRAGGVSAEKIAGIEERLATTAGTCGVMGTASTMACIAETLGMMPPNTAAIPAVLADRLRAAEDAGARAAAFVANPIRPSQIITEHAVENALRVLLALGGSTNALIHLTAIAGRRGIQIDLNRLNELSDTTPVLVDLKPTGEGYMEDFHAAGGVPALLWELRDLLHPDPIDVTGIPLGERLRGLGAGAKEEALLALLAHNPAEKKMVFVHHRESLAHLAALLARRGLPFARFDGSLSGPEKDAAVAEFRARVPLLLCSESGGEGRNLQFCNTLINFDIPWNPMAIEQRIGRIDRIGQSQDVFVFNLVSAGTIEDAVLRILDEKINMFELVVGEVGAILGAFEEERDFSTLVLDAWLETTEEARARAFARIEDQILAARRDYEGAKALDEALFGAELDAS
ncbi:MAG: dihydroxy-acid dehydratase [Acetobacteraceae bacterium]